MKKISVRVAILMLMSALGMIFSAGCQSKQTGDKPGEEMNSAMTQQQKDAIAAHKKQTESPQNAPQSQ